MYDLILVGFGWIKRVWPQGVGGRGVAPILDLHDHLDPLFCHGLLAVATSDTPGSTASDVLRRIEHAARSTAAAHLGGHDLLWRRAPSVDRFGMEVRTGKGSKSNDLGFQNDSQIDDLGVPGGSGRGPRAPKSTSKGGPGGVREGSWLQVALGWVSGAGFARFGVPLGGGSWGQCWTILAIFSYPFFGAFWTSLRDPSWDRF